MNKWMFSAIHLGACLTMAAATLIVGSALAQVPEEQINPQDSSKSDTTKIGLCNMEPNSEVNLTLVDIDGVSPHANISMKFLECFNVWNYERINFINTDGEHTAYRIWPGESYWFQKDGGKIKLFK